MIRNSTFHPLARREFGEAIEYYECEKPGLGLAFLGEFERTLADVVSFPEAAPLVRAGVRRKRLARFPYAMIYCLLPDSIRILAVMSAKRRPFFWRGGS